MPLIIILAGTVNKYSAPLMLINLIINILYN